jgi:hypothetical protein
MDWIHEIEKLKTRKPSNQPIWKVSVAACGRES